MAYLIQGPNGEQCIVKALAGHEDCTVLSSNAAEPSPDSLEARRNGMTKAELFDEIVGEFQANGIITATVAAKMRAAAK